MKLTYLLSGMLFIGFLSCQNSAVPSSPEPNTTISSALAAVEGVRWSLAELPDHSGNLPEIARAVFIRLDSGRVTGFAGCNNIFGSYALSGDTLHFNPVGATKKFCNTGMDIENLLLQSLAMTTNYKQDGNKLQLLRTDSLLVSFTSQRD